MPGRTKRILALKGCRFIRQLLREQNLQGNGAGEGWGASANKGVSGTLDSARVTELVVQRFRASVGQCMFSFFESQLNPDSNEQ